MDVEMSWTDWKSNFTRLLLTPRVDSKWLELENYYFVFYTFGGIVVKCLVYKSSKSRNDTDLDDFERNYK
jgi:hypothetical protein